MYAYSPSRDYNNDYRLVQGTLNLFGHAKKGAYISARTDSLSETIKTAWQTRFCEIGKSLGMKLDSIRFDDAIGHLQEALTYYDPTLLRTEFQEYKYADPALLVPHNPMQAPGLDSILKQWITRRGRWRMAAEATTNTPPLDIETRDIRYGFKYFEAHIEYTTRELDQIQTATQLNNVGLVIDRVQEKMRAVEEAYQETLNEVNSTGFPLLGMYGLHTHPNIQRIQSPNLLGLDRSSDENIAALTLISQRIRANSRQRSYADILVMPDGLAQELNQQKVGDSADRSTLDWFLAHDPWIQDIEITPEIETVGPNNSPIIHAYRRDPSRVECMIPKPMSQKSAPYQQNGRWRLDFDCQFGGVHVVRPYDHAIIENVYVVP